MILSKEQIKSLEKLLELWSDSPSLIFFLLSSSLLFLSSAFFLAAQILS